MINLYYLPIEPLPMRYSIEWRKYFKNGLKRFKQFNDRFFIKDAYSFNVIDIDPQEQIPTQIIQGQFLDYINTHKYRGVQLETILNLFNKKAIKDNDIFFFDDIWFPGIEILAYIRNFSGIKFKIVGCLHDGSYDPADPTAQVGINTWGHHFEYMLTEFVDLFFVATNFSKNLFLKYRPKQNPNKIIVTGFPIETPQEYITNQLQFRERTPVIAFTHRRSPEKNPDFINEFNNLLILQQNDYANISCYKVVPTFDFNFSKQEYYEWLSLCKFAISWAELENWGIGMAEATLCGAIPIVPNNLSYKELYLPEFKYESKYHDILTTDADCDSTTLRIVAKKEISFGNKYHDFLQSSMATLKKLIQMSENERASLLRKQQCILETIGISAVPKMLESIINRFR